jgi:hypothetical protein
MIMTENQIINSKTKNLLPRAKMQDENPKMEKPGKTQSEK